MAAPRPTTGVDRHQLPPAGAGPRSGCASTAKRR